MKYLLILVLIVSCASDKKKAIELSEKGKHEQAIEFWARALQDDPDDEEISNGFQASLDVVSNDRLTRIRDKRLANNMQAALEELKGLVDLQKKWNIKLDFNSSSFQGKEVRYVWPYYKSTILAKIGNKLPLGAESDHKDYKDVFNSMKEYEEVQALINKSGRQKCTSLKKQHENKPFLASFVSQFCHYWNPGSTVSSTISSVLYSRTAMETNITNINQTYATGLHASMDKEMKATPWFHPEAKKEMRVKLNGEYTWQTNSRHIQQAHNYTEKVPYTDYESVSKTREVPYSAYENGTYVTKYRSESYTEKEPVTKYRSVHRVYEYEALKKSLEITLNLSGMIYVEKENFPFFFQKNVGEEKILHDYNLPNIGLYPQREDISNPMDRFEALGNALALQFAHDLNAIWEKSFCTLPGKRDFASIGENVTRCRKLGNYPEFFVDSWFNTQFGVTAKKTQELIGQF